MLQQLPILLLKGNGARNAACPVINKPQNAKVFVLKTLSENLKKTLYVTVT